MRFVKPNKVCGPDCPVLLLRDSAPLPLNMQFARNLGTTFAVLLWTNKHAWHSHVEMVIRRSIGRHPMFILVPRERPRVRTLTWYGEIGPLVLVKGLPVWTLLRSIL